MGVGCQYTCQPCRGKSLTASAGERQLSRKAKKPSGLESWFLDDNKIRPHRVLFTWLTDPRGFYCMHMTVTWCRILIVPSIKSSDIVSLITVTEIILTGYHGFSLRHADYHRNCLLLTHGVSLSPQAAIAGLVCPLWDRPVPRTLPGMVPLPWPALLLAWRGFSTKHHSRRQALTTAFL